MMNKMMNNMMILTVKPILITVAIAQMIMSTALPAADAANLILLLMLLLLILSLKNYRQKSFYVAPTSS